MRDDQIIQRQQNDAKRIAMIYRQSVFMDTRLQAMESMLLGGRWKLFLYLLNPAKLLAEVNRRQDVLLKRHDEEMMASARKADEEAKKPKIQIVPANGAVNGGSPRFAALIPLFILIFISPACVTAARHRREVDLARREGFKDADAQCVNLQNRLGQYMRQLQERLTYLRQLNDDGALKPAKGK